MTRYLAIAVLGITLVSTSFAVEAHVPSQCDPGELPLALQKKAEITEQINDLTATMQGAVKVTELFTHFMHWDGRALKSLREWLECIAAD